MTTKKFAVRLVAENGRQFRAEIEGIGNVGADSFRRMSREVDSTGIMLRRLAGIAAGAFSIRQVAQYADTWTDLNSRVQLATSSQEQGAAVMQRLADMARRTYSSIEQTTEGWLGNVRALRDLGLSTRETLDFTEALNNAMVVSGAKAERATRVQEALSKAMALGTLRGDNLNSVIQQGGRVAELLAEELGTTVSGLRQMGAQGKITGDVIRRALVGNLELLREEADSMPATIGDAFLLIRNAALQLVGTWDQVVGASSLVADALIAVADNLERLASYALAFAAVMAGRWVVAFAAARLATFSLAGALTALRGALIRTGIGALIVGAGELIYQFGQLVKGAGGFGEALNLLKDVALEAFGRIKDAFGLIPLAVKAGAAQMKAWFLAALEDMLQAFQDLTWSVASGLNDLFGTSLQGARIDAISGMGTGTLSRMVGAAMVEAAGARRELAAAADAVSAPLESWEALGAAIMRAGEDGESALDDAADAADRVTEALDRAGGAGGRAGRAVAAGAEEAATGWAKVVEDLNSYADKAMDFAGGIGDVLGNAFQSAEQALRNFTEGGKISFKDMVRSMLADLAMLAWRSSILGPLAKAVGGAISGDGFMATLASVLHSGGIVGMGGAGRMVPAMAFAEAPRFHGGGWPGLRPDEVPAILQRGERVLSRQEVARGSGESQNINITVNVEGANGDGHVVALVRQGVDAALGAYNRSLPDRVRQINNDPRGR